MPATCHTSEKEKKERAGGWRSRYAVKRMEQNAGGGTRRCQVEPCGQTPDDSFSSAVSWAFCKIKCWGLH